MYFLIPILVHSILSSFVLLTDPPVWPDEPYFVTTAESVLATGKPSMPLYRTEGIGSPEIRMYSYPPLYFYILALWIKIFDSSITSIRIFSLVLSVICIYIFFRLLMRFAKNTWYVVMGSLALVLFGPFSMASRVGRMDIVVLLGILSTLYFTSPLVSGISAGLTVLFHPLGFLAPVFGIFVLKRKIKSYGLFILPVLLSLLLWLFLFSDRIDLFVSQMQLQFLYKSGREALIVLLFKNDIFWRILTLFYLFLGSTGIILGVLRKQVVPLMTGIGTYVLLLVLIYAVDQWYLLFLPIFPILFSVWRKNIFVVSLLCILHGYSLIPGFVTHIQRNENYKTFSLGISREIPQGKTVVLSVIPDPFFELRKRDDLTIYQIPHVTEPGKLKHLLDAADIVVYNYVTNKELEPYLKTYTEKKTTVIQEGGYQADVVFLAR